MKRVVTIGGSDSSGGAGIQADIKTFAAIGVHGTCVLTAVTAQNSMGVQDILEVPVEVVNAQMESIITDIGVDYAKTGMLPSSKSIMGVASVLREHAVPFVLDPVLKSGSGGTLMDPDAVDTLLKHLLPLCNVVTPNIGEASALSGLEIRTLSEMREAAIALHQMGAPAVIIKGGHLERETAAGRATDIVYDGETFRELTLEYQMKGGRILHGSGCSFSAALAAELAKGHDLWSAAGRAKAFVHDAIMLHELISNFMVVNPVQRLRADAERYRVRENVREALRMLSGMNGFKEVIPEVGTNIGMAIEDARSEYDVAAVDGRIHPVHDHGALRLLSGCVEFGVSSHIARMILAMMRYDAAKRSAINIKYTPELVSACEDAGLRVSWFERDDEPPGVATMAWGVEEAVKRCDSTPDVIFDRGGRGKEAMIRIFDTSAVGVVKRLEGVLRSEG